MTDKKYVYLVKQTQPDDEYQSTTIYVCTDKNEAIRRARILNKEYGTTDICDFDENWDFECVKDDCEFCYACYYEVEAIQLDEPMAYDPEKQGE